ncbi:MAG TPA: DUF4118 domain-containing protein [Candidatus Sulfotelmatobacter sp.]|nr:DUF4118 domain-containing protein [Candidatus Sulfotelmatobacter sp.]
MQRLLGTRVLGVIVSLLVVAGIVLAYRHVLRVNQTTVALSFLLAILAVSAVWGMLISAFMSVVAMLAFNYYFLPPVGAHDRRAAELGGAVRVSGHFDYREPAFFAHSQGGR